MAREPSLNGYLFFEAVARRGTVSKAADELSVSSSAVSQQIKLLEQQMGLRLFRRDGRSLSLTLEGEQLFQASSAAIRMLRDARRNLGQTSDLRRLAIRVSPSFGVRWLGPRLSAFVAEHPEWKLRVDAAPDPTNFDREIMDLDIRYGFGDWAGLHAAPLARDIVLPLVAPALRDRLDPARPLEDARLIDSARALCPWETWLAEAGLVAARNDKSLLIDRSSMALQLAADGAGVVLESLALALPEIRAGALIPLCPAAPALAFPAYWLVCPHRHMNRRSVRRFTEWATQEAMRHEAEAEALLAQAGVAIRAIDPRQTLNRRDT
ncbi:MAG: LysR substrate-binding domain-containing protein [Tranquillimonas sp.]